MLRHLRHCLASASMLIFAGVASAAAIPTPLARVLAAAGIPPSAASFLVMDVESGQVAFDHESGTPRSPASTLKLVTTYAALDALGPAYTWHTLALAGGSLRDGILDGDLVLQGGGDPYLTLDRWWDFARQLRAGGLRAIRGDIVVDDGAFAVVEDPAAFDGRPNRDYNVLPAALMVNFQAIDFRVRPDTAARRIDLIADPAPPNLAVDNRIRYVDGRCSTANNRVDFEVLTAAWDRVQLSGRLSGRCAEREFSRVLLTPPQYAYGTFVEFWRQLGGEFSGHLRIERAPADAVPLLRYESLTLAEVIRLTNKYSNNLMARHLLLTLGAERFGAPATVAKGLAAVDAWSHDRGLALADVRIENGAGLSRAARVTAGALGGVLRQAYHSRFAPEFLASLPLGGVDGTLRTRLKDSPPGAVRMKTGHLDGVSALAGYVTSGSGRTFVVVSLLNHGRVDSGVGEPVHAALVDWVLEEL